MEILDCTLRDGGYVNNWQFSERLVQHYREAIEQSPITKIEIGFRSRERNSQFGLYAYTPPSEILTFRSSLPGKQIGFMINSKELVGSDSHSRNWEESFGISRELQSEQPNFVRLAANFNDLERVRELFELNPPHSDGVEFILNVMQAHAVNDFSEFEKPVWSKNFSTIYLADSFGSMEPRDVRRSVNSLKRSWSGEVGFHAHDNFGLAVANSLEAINSGASIIDGTVRSVGRGAGNASTESLLLSTNVPEGYWQKIRALSHSDFRQLQAEFPWGPNIYYQLAAKLDIHPTFVQAILSENRYSGEDIYQALLALGDTGRAGSFSPDLVDQVFHQVLPESPGAHDPSSVFKTKNLIVVARGSSTEGKGNVAKFMKAQDSVEAVAINSPPPNVEIGFDFLVSANPFRMRLEQHNARDFSGVVVAPLSAAKELGIHFVKDGIDVGYNQLYEVLANDELIGLVPRSTVLYTLAIAVASGVKRVILIGVDGKKPNGVVDQEFANGLKEFVENSEMSVFTLEPNSLGLEVFNPFLDWED